MTVFHRWLDGPKRLLVSFTLLLLVPAAAVVWLGLRLLDQDRAIEARQLLERREAAADRLVSGLEQALSGTEHRLWGGASSVPILPDEDAVLVVGRTGSIAAYPADRLLFLAEAPVAPPEPAAAFEAGEALEYGAKDSRRAAEAFGALARTSNKDVRAGALLRLARNLRKLNQNREALAAYTELVGLPQAQLLGLPADLVGRRARCVLLRDLGRDSYVVEARALLADLIAARWRIDHGTFEAYVRQIDAWLGTASPIPAERAALSAAAEWAWQQRTNGPLPAAGRRALRFGGIDVAVLWQADRDRFAAIVAGPRFQQRAWFAPVGPQLEARGMAVALIGPGGESVRGPDLAGLLPAVRRSSAETGLPWTVLIAAQPAGTGLDEFTRRRRTLLAGVSLLLVLVITGSYFALRAVSRELAVARLQTDFVAAVSHEFRTPLTSLQQFTALLNDEDEPPPAKRRAFYQAQARGVDRLRRLVESLLDFGRMEAGARVYQLAPIDPVALVRAVVADFEREASAGGFTIQCAATERAVAVRADAEALARALWNLLENAVKYSGDHRCIFVSVDVQDGAVLIAVRDEGLGIPRAEQRAIFDKFVRGEASRAHGIKGAGIGLSMVRHIVRAHGGSVRVISAPGAGATFTMALPVVAPAEITATERG